MSAIGTTATVEVGGRRIPFRTWTSVCSPIRISPNVELGQHY